MQWLTQQFGAHNDVNERVNDDNAALSSFSRFGDTLVNRLKTDCINMLVRVTVDNIVALLRLSLVGTPTPRTRPRTRPSSRSGTFSRGKEVTRENRNNNNIVLLLPRSKKTETKLSPIWGEQTYLVPRHSGGHGSISNKASS
jgi:hypothetical protein